MFEVVINYDNGSAETYDCVSEIQATCIFFKAKSKDSVVHVELNEIVEVDDAVINITQ